MNTRIKIIVLLLFTVTSVDVFAQLDYSNMDNWAFHPAKSGTLIDGYNLDIAKVNKDLNTMATLPIVNNAMTNTGVDVFFVHPTLLLDIGAYSTRINIPLADQSTGFVSASILGQAGLLAKYGRFFAPRYRQASPPTFLNSPLDSTQAAVIGVAYNDVKAAFLNYINHYNNENKFILASHSQGAYLTAMLLADVFDNDTALQNKLVTAVIAGVANAYATPFQTKGGWWENIPVCSTMDQCNCVMTWRSYKKGQTLPAVQPSLPCLNPNLQSEGFVYRLMNTNQDWLMQDSLYYSSQATPLRNYIVPKTNQPYGGNVGFIAFDSLYQIQYRREDLTRLGFVIEHTPQTNDQRPNDLLGEESKPFFNYYGYHFKDYNIYSWALMQQIDMKLATCANTSGLEASEINSKGIKIYPNPSKSHINIKSTKTVVQVDIYDVYGQLILSKTTQNKELSLSVETLSSGIFFVKITLNNGNSDTKMVVKEE